MLYKKTSSGYLWHLVKSNNGSALCGAKPAHWSSTQPQHGYPPVVNICRDCLGMHIFMRREPLPKPV